MIQPFTSTFDWSTTIFGGIHQYLQKSKQTSRSLHVITKKMNIKDGIVHNGYSQKYAFLYILQRKFSNRVFLEIHTVTTYSVTITIEVRLAE